jgi:hypothetical protein
MVMAIILRLLFFLVVVVMVVVMVVGFIIVSVVVILTLLAFVVVMVVRFLIVRVQAVHFSLLLGGSIGESVLPLVVVVHYPLLNLVVPVMSAVNILASNTPHK